MARRPFPRLCVDFLPGFRADVLIGSDREERREHVDDRQGGTGAFRCLHRRRKRLAGRLGKIRCEDNASHDGPSVQNRVQTLRRSSAGIPAMRPDSGLQLPLLCGPTARSRGIEMFQQILCPIDFSDSSHQAIQYATALARQHKSVLTVLHVAPDGSETRPLATEAAALFEDARQAGVKVEVLIEGGQPARQILNRAAALPANVIVLGTHGTGGFEHLMLGSVAEKVLRKATCPVFTVPPQANFIPGAPFTALVCAVDFSEWSLAALDEACVLAEGARA